MSDYQPKKGDRVRVVLEGEVTTVWTDGSEFVLAGLNGIEPSESHVVSVEKVAPPLPTTPGSVIRDEAGSVRMLGITGRWYHAENAYSFGLTTEAAMDLGYRPIFDAGEVTP